jgi:hypothetical protein
MAAPHGIQLNKAVIMKYKNPTGYGRNPVTPETAAFSKGQAE